MSPPINTTAPRGGRRGGGERDSELHWALVILFSKKEPWREGEVGLLKYFTDMLFGRANPGDERFMHFARQLPGVPLPPNPYNGCVAGDSLSRPDTQFHAGIEEVEMKVVGRHPVLVNGVPLMEAELHEGDVLHWEGEFAVLVTRRPAVLPPMKSDMPIHKMGGPDEDKRVGESPVMWTCRDQIRLHAAGKHHIRVTGESGSGKNDIARTLHERSNRAKGPFREVNVAAIPEELLIPEVFGNLKNYPNPGTPARPGILGGLDGGTLHLDEGGELSKPGQAMFLRTMENHEHRILGEEKSRPIDVRIIVTSHQPDDVYREDFLNRLGGHIHMPSLRERREDIPLLVRHLLVTHERAPHEERYFRVSPSGEVLPQVSDHLIVLLVMHPPKANVRGLKTLLIKAMLKSRGDVIEMAPEEVARASSSKEPRPSDTAPIPSDGPAVSTTAPVSAPPSMDGVKSSTPSSPQPSSRGRSPLGPYSQDELVALLERARWNIVQVADDLGVHRNTVDRWMKAHKIERPKSRR
jgi:two-component system nitrogen regulation response regulator GlnG/two-component system response regulator HydG